MYCYILIDFFILSLKSLSKYRKYTIFILFWILIFFTAFRPEIGGYDYSIYKNLFENMPDIFNFKINFNTITYDLLYSFSNSLVRTFTDNFEVYIFIYTFFSHILLFKIIKEYSMDFFYSMFVYFSSYYLWHNFTLLRQNIAMLLFWIAIKYIKNSDFKKYLFYIIIAALFHKSAILLLIFYPIIKYLSKITINKKILISFIVVGAKLFIEIIIKLLYLFLSYLNIGGANLKKYISSSGTGINKLFFLETILIIAFIFIKRNNKIIIKNDIFINLLFLSFYISVLFSNYEIFVRFLEYFRIYYILIIPALFYTIKNKAIKNVYYILTLVYFIFRLYRYLNTFDYGSLLTYFYALIY